jgi:hypothetical protein
MITILALKILAILSWDANIKQQFAPITMLALLTDVIQSKDAYILLRFAMIKMAALMIHATKSKDAFSHQSTSAMETNVPEKLAT